MANVFKSAKEIVQEMCDDYKELTGVTLLPEQTDNTTVIKFWTDAGAISSWYAETQRSLNDCFPTTASDEGLVKHLQTRSLEGRIQPQKSHGQIQFTLTGPASIDTTAQVQRVSDGAIYNCIQAGIGSGPGSLVLFFESNDSGNNQNLDSINEPFSLVTPFINVEASCLNVSKFLDGRDLETSTEMLNRILIHDRDDNSGGNAAAYEAWALAASTEVVSSKCLRLVRGPDTVDVIITSGTNDISAAVEAAQVVSRLPSAALILEVQNYINTKNPVTDDVLVKAPIEEPFNVTVHYSLYSETAANRSYVDGEINKVIKIFILSAKPQDILRPTDLERAIDRRVGDLIKERNVENFSGLTTYYTVPDNKIESVGIITLGAL
jgi:uncharacterized phage protein gp47/JayE